MKRLAAWAGTGLVVLVGAAAVGFRIWIGAAAPPLRGREAIPGIGDSVVVLWDSLAVPHILARSDSDAFAALGYLHARDRLWEMDLLRHAAEGRLSELFGTRTLGTDQVLRSREIGRLARERLTHASDGALHIAAAYARGVNAWIAGGHRPPELRLLGHTPEPWLPVHSMEVGLVEAWDLHTDNGEIAHARELAELGPARAADLFVAYPDSAPVIVEGTAGPGPAAWRSSSEEARATASNSWAIGPSHTRSRKPILENDPHLALSAPSIWYLAGVHAPDYEVVGVTIPGLPVVVLGHTADHGWGFTNGMIDDVDYVEERITPDTARYRTPSGWADVEMVTETLHVKGADPVVYRRGRTADGPLVDVGWRPDSTTAFALRWTAQTPSDELTALMAMARARNVAEFEAALVDFRVPEQNIVYADRDGTIAYFLAGRVPVRAAGDGATPTPGWTGAGRWTRFLAAPELPREVNPPSGFVVTANNRIVGDAYPIPIRADYDLPERAERIWEMVRRDSNATAAAVAREQVDVVNVFLRRVAPVAARAADAAGRSDLGDRLRRWDGAMAPDRIEPTLMWSWYRELQALTYDDESPGFRPQAPLHRWLLAGSSPWFDDVRTPEHEDLAMLSRRAMDSVLARGAPRPWGEIHTHTERHPLGGVPLLGRLAGFNVGPLHLGGGNNTVAVCPSAEYAPPFTCTEGPSMRHVVDFGDVDGAGGFILPAGQSGNPRSPHYRDQTARWIRGELWVVPVDVRRVHATDTLRLVP
ncbi:MAG: penicillin acylase family protein [Gemmatimonadota bacterium]